MKFSETGFAIIRQAVSKDLANFCYNYLRIRKKVLDSFIKTKYISPYDTDWGNYVDIQAPNTFSLYGDIAMENLLIMLKGKMQTTTNLELVENYAYARLYKNNDVLERHKDRFSCEISTTMFLGGEKWPIYLSPYKNVGRPEDQGGPKGVTFKSNEKGIKVDLEIGDMLLYKGNIIEHWREQFKGEECAQVFLHYNDKNTPGAEKNIYDRRPHIGLPEWFRGKKIKEIQ